MVRPKAYDQLSTSVRALFWAAIWAVLYLFLVVALPANLGTMQNYHLSPTQYRILALITGLPIPMVWFVLFYG